MTTHDLENGKYVSLQIAMNVLNAREGTIVALVEAGMLAEIRDDKSRTFWYPIDEITAIGRRRKSTETYDAPIPREIPIPVKCAKCKRKTNRPVTYGALDARMCEACKDSVESAVYDIHIERMLREL